MTQLGDAGPEVSNMQTLGQDTTVDQSGPAGLSPEHRVALSQASTMISQGHTPETAIDHLVACDMPRLVARVLVKQYGKFN